MKRINSLSQYWLTSLTVSFRPVFMNEINKKSFRPVFMNEINKKMTEQEILGFQQPCSRLLTVMLTLFILDTDKQVL